MARFDIAIVGTGPAGVSAALTAKARNKSILLLGSAKLSDKVSKAHRILNYPGLPDVTGEQLAEAFRGHLDAMELPVTEQRVHAIYAMGDYFALQTTENEMWEATTVILATGVMQGKELPGEQEFLGRGVSYCATCDAPLYRGKTVAVIGYNAEAEQEARFLTEVAGQVLYFPMYRAEPELPDSVTVLHEMPTALVGGLKAEAVQTAQGLHAADCVFVLRDSISPAQLVPGLELRDQHIAVDLSMCTNLPGCFACGDAVGRPYQYVKAAGQGNVAALSAVAYLDSRK